MPLVSTLGAASSRGFGQFGGSSTPAPGYGSYIEDIFSTYLYTGNGSTQTINNGMGLATTGAWGTYQLSSSTDIAHERVKFDSSNNMYVVGANSTYAYVVKYNSSGVVQWQRTFTTTGTAFRGISFDSSGNVYCAGLYLFSGKYYILLVKYDSSGTLQWQRKLGDGVNNSAGNDVAVDSSGNVYILGQASQGSQFISLAKYDATGAIQWQKSIVQGAGGSSGNSIYIDSSDNIYIGGNTYDNANSITFAILLKLDTSGNILLQRRLTQGAFVSEGICVTADSSGNMYLGGYFTTSTANQAYVAKYNSAGTLQWQRAYYVTTGAGGYVNGVSVDSSGNVYTTGYVNPSVGNQYWFVVKYDSSGTLQWQRKIDTSASAGNYSGRGIALYSSNVYVSGYYYDGTLNSGVIVSLQSDGSSTSGVELVSLSVGSATSTTSSMTSATPTATVNTSSLTDSAAGLTGSSGTFTPTIYSQPAITSGGGLVWIRQRDAGGASHALFDTSRPITQILSTDLTAITTNSAGYGLTSFNANGFSLNATSFIAVNNSSANYVSWTFTKTPKFFDVVTYTGNGIGSTTISHNLNSVPGMIIVKRTDTNENWCVMHRYDGSSTYYKSSINSSNTGTTIATPITSFATSTTFKPGSINGDGDVPSQCNINGATYVAYLFAHNAGGFGNDGTQNVISCGIFTADGSGNATVNLGYEPQYLLIKDTTSGSSWNIFDIMRGFSNTGATRLFANSNSAESTLSGEYVVPTATGFNIRNGIAGPGDTWIYMAIRRGPMRTPTSGTSVFSPVAVSSDSSSITTNFVVDAFFSAMTTTVYDKYSVARLNNRSLATNTNAAEINNITPAMLQSNTSLVSPNLYGGPSVYWSMQRAPGFMDVVCYTGTGSTTTQAHNLGVVPELIIVKKRDTTGGWPTYSSPTGNNKYLYLNTTAAANVDSTLWNNTSPTSSVFTVGTDSAVNGSGSTFIAYLFATCPGVSKVGSYTGTGSTQTINCGFTGGARFVLIKRTDSTSNWYVWDTARGMVSGTDPSLLLNTNLAQTNANNVYTTTGGFQIVSSLADINASGGSYIFLAIA